MNNKKKNPKNAGKKRDFEDEVLLKIIDMFLINEYRGEINASLLARYASENFEGFSKIRYYHFTNHEIPKNKIEEIQQEKRRKFVSAELYSFQNIQIDSFVEKYYNNKPKLREVLNALQIGEKAMFDRMVRLEAHNNKLELELKKIQDFEENSKIIIKEFKKRNKDLQDKVKDLQNLVEVDNQIEMYKYVSKKTFMSGDVAEQYRKILLKCGIIKEKDSKKVDSAMTTDDEVEDDLVSRSNVIQMLREKGDKLVKEPHKNDTIEMDEFENVPMNELLELLGYDSDENDQE